jgi:hypothetical protein
MRLIEPKFATVFGTMQRYELRYGASATLSQFSAVLALLLLSGCAQVPVRTSNAELFVTPTAFLVDGVPFATADDAVAHLMLKNPADVSLPSCGAMPTSRVLDVMRLLRERFKGHLIVSVVGESERGCPAFERS